MNDMDVVVGTFLTTADARAAAAAIASTLRVDEDLLSLERVRIRGDERGRKRVVLVASVAARERRRARDIIWQHQGRQVPFDWLSSQQDKTFPAVPTAVRRQTARMTADVTASVSPGPLSSQASARARRRSHPPPP